MSGRNASQAVKRYPGIQIQTSSLGLQIPLGWGTFRCSTNLVWYGAFTSKATSTSSGGKGGAQTTGYTYNASFVLAICEGPIDGVSVCYVDSSVYTNGPSVADPSGVGTALSQANLGMNTGAIGQAPWSYLTGNFAADAIGYSGLAICYGQNYPLDSSATTPNFSFEVERFASFGGATTAPDADPSLVMADFFQNTRTGVPMWPASGLLDAVSLTTAANSYQKYCLASGLLLSPLIDQERSAADFLTECLLATNSTVVWSEGVLKFIPYGDVAMTGHGATYTPNLTPVYSLNDDDFVVDNSGDPPLQVDIEDQTDAYNVVQLEYLDRTNQYNIAIALASDAANVAQYGARRQDPTTTHVIGTPAVAAAAAQLYLQRTLYVRAQYKFKLGWMFALLEPGDLVELTDAGMGLAAYPVRIIQIDEDEKYGLSLTCEDLLVGIANSPLYTVQNALGQGPGINLDPGGVESNLLIYSGDVSNAAWTKTGCTVTGNATTDQYGLSTAATLVPTASAGGGIGTPVQLAAANSAGGGGIGTPVQLGVASQTAGATILNLTTVNTAPAGDLIVVHFVFGATSAPTSLSITDSAGNSYTLGTPVQEVGTLGGYLLQAWCQNCIALPSGGTITASVSAAALGSMNMGAVAVSGIASTGAVDIQGAGTTNAGGTSPSIATGTLGQAAEIVFGSAYISLGAADTFTEASGFTSNTPSLLTSHAALRTAYNIRAATTSVTYAPTLGTSREYAANVISFKAAPAAAATLVLTTTANSPAGNLLYVAASIGANFTINSVTDSAGNTYTAGTAIINTGADSTARPFYCANALHLPAGGTITVTYSGTSTDQEASAISVSGIATSSPLDIQAAGSKGTGTAPSIATGTLGQAAEIVLGLTHVHAGGSDTYTEASGFTANAIATAGGSNSALHSAYKIVAATTSITYAPTLGTSRDYASNVLTFKGAGGTSAAHAVSQSITAFAGINYVGAVCIQKDVHKNARVTLADSGGTNGAYVEVDTNAGTILTQGTAIGTGILVSAVLLPTLVSGIWQVVIAVQVPAATTLKLTVNALDDSGALSWIGDASNALNLSQAQLRQGVQIGEYAQTLANPDGPLIFNPPTVLTTTKEVWAALAGGPNWGGANVWTSVDGVNYQLTGTFNGGARYGVLTAAYGSAADPDSTDTLSVDLGASDGSLTSASEATADQGGTLCLVDNELICFSTATLTNPSRYNLSTYVRRGYLNSAIAAHAAGAPFVRLDGSPFQLPYFAGSVGQTVYAKFQSFNIYGKGLVALSDCIAYPFTAVQVSAAPPVAAAWTAFGTTLSNGGVATPVIEITGASDNPSASGIEFLYRVTGTSVWASGGVGSNSTTLKHITSVQSGQTYDVAIAYIVGGLVTTPQVIASAITVGAASSGSGSSIVGTNLLNDSVPGTSKTFVCPAGSYTHVDIVLTGIGGAGIFYSTGGKSFTLVNLGGGGGGTAVTLTFAVTPGTTTFTYTIPSTVGASATVSASGLISMTAHSGTSATTTAEGVGGAATGGATANYTGHNGGLTNAWDGGGAASAAGAYIDQTTNGTAGNAPGGGGAGGTFNSSGSTLVPSPGSGACLQIIARA